MPKVTVSCLRRADSTIQGAETHGLIGDTAIALLQAGAQTDKRDSDGFLALDLAPDKGVRTPYRSPIHLFSTSIYPLNLLNPLQVRKYIEREAENEGIEL